MLKEKIKNKLEKHNDFLSVKSSNEKKENLGNF